MARSMQEFLCGEAFVSYCRRFCGEAEGLLGADAAGEQGVEAAVVAGDLKEAAGVETGGGAGIAAGLVDADTLAAGPGGGLRETFQDSGACSNSCSEGGRACTGKLAAEFEFEGVEFVVEREQEILDEGL